MQPITTVPFSTPRPLSPRMHGLPLPLRVLWQPERLEAGVLLHDKYWKMLSKLLAVAGVAVADSF